MDTRQLIRALKTPVTLLVLVAVVYFAARWGWDAARAPIPPRPPAPCVVREVGPVLKPEHVYVSVYNGSKTNGMAKRLGSLGPWQGQASSRRTRTGTSPNSERNVAR